MTETIIPSAFRDAFLRADIRDASTETCQLVVKRLKTSIGQVRRRQLWNKQLSDGPRPMGAGKRANLKGMGL